MAGAFSKVMRFFGVDREEYDEEALGPTVAETTTRTARPVTIEDPIQLPPRVKNEKIVNHPDAIAHKVVVFHPDTVDSTNMVINELLDGRSLVINLEDIDTTVAQRIIDTLSGAIYAVNGNLKRVARQIYMLTPSFVEVVDRDSSARSPFGAMGMKRHD